MPVLHGLDLYAKEKQRWTDFDFQLEIKGVIQI